ncbi:helix-turn-helix transcriptional regulator [Spirillospora sp. NPDC052269]
MTDVRPAWAARLQAAREQRGWNKREMARRLFLTAKIPNGNVDSLARQIRGYESGEHFPRDWTEHYAAAFGSTPTDLFGEAQHPQPPDVVDSAIVEVLEMAASLERSDIGDGELHYLDVATRRLTYDYARQPPLTVLGEAHGLQHRITTILRDHRLRLAQRRELLATSAELFALINLLAGDVGRYREADAYGYAAWTCAHEADSDAARALVLCAQTKTARWEGRYREAAELARRGYELAPTSARGRVLLAASAATALQSRGDIAGARDALVLAERAREVGDAADQTADAWSCTRARQHTYALQVGLGAREPTAMLASAEAADDAWAEGDEWVYGTWAQVRIGAALAYVMTGDPDRAESELEPVFDLEDHFRVVTIVGRMGEVRQRLAHSRYKSDRRAEALRERIHLFQTGSLEHKAIGAAEES